MRRIRLFLILSLWTLPLFGQEQNVDMLGRWAEGQCEAVFRRGGFTFVGNGSYLEVYKNRNAEYQRLDQILLPATVEDIWVKGDTTHVFAACGDTGVQVVYFNHLTGKFVQIIGRYNTNGHASAVMESSGYTYVADGPAGLLILYTGIPSNPTLSGSFPTSGYARELWISGTLALVAADTSGIYAVNVTSPSSPVLLDQIDTPAQFPDRPEPAALSVLVSGADTLAYVGAGWGGLQIISINNPANLKIKSIWPNSGIPLYVQDVWVSGDYAHLACLDKGLYTQIDISDIHNITGPVSFALETDGLASKIVVDGDTAFTSDRFNGHLLVDVNINNSPSILKTIGMADASYDVDYSQEYLYAAAGLSGLKIFHVQSTYTNEKMFPVGAYNTPGKAMGVTASGAYAYVADGNGGLRIFDVTDRTKPTLKGSYTQATDTCYAVAVPAGSYVFAACGHDGLRILDYSDFNSIWSAYRLDTPGSARAIKIDGNKGFLADSSSVRVYQFTGLPGIITNVSEIDALTSNPAHLEARSIDVKGDTVLIANGRFGLLIWHRDTDRLDSLNVGGVCTDVEIIENTIYVTVAGRGVLLYNYSVNGEINQIGVYKTAGVAQKLRASDTGNRIWVASGVGGLYDLESSLKPEISINPTYLDFGNVPPGFSRERKVWITNPGTKDLIVNRIQLVGLTTAFSFSETAFTVPPGETKRILVTFTPPLLGASSHVATASIYSNAINSPVTLFLQGEGATPNQETPYKNDVFTLGLWHLDEADGVTTVTDASGNNLAGQPVGSTPRVNSRTGFNRAIQFNGDGGRIAIANHAVLNVYNTPFTLEMWFSIVQKPTGTAVLAKRGIGQTQQIELSLSAEGANQGLVGRIWKQDGAELAVRTGSLQTIRTGQWYHAAFSWDGDSLRLYLNGVYENGRSFFGSFRSIDNQPLAIGAASDGATPFSGIIDEVRFSSIARQTWEFNVNHSQLSVTQEFVHFGDVIVNQIRRFPFTLRSVGDALLTVYGVSATDNRVSVSAHSGFTLESGQDTTLWLTFLPTVSGYLPANTALVIASTDPTFPLLDIPITGRGVETFPAGTQKTDPFTLGLYHFDKVQETTVFDSSGYGFDGTLHGGILLDTTGGKFGQYLSVNGVEEYCSVDSLSNPDWGPNWGGLTAEAWINLNKLPVDSNAIVLKRGTDEEMQFDIRVDKSARVIGRFWNSSGRIHTVTSPSTELLVSKQWYHIACTLDLYSDSLALFINGRMIARTPFQGRFAGSLSEDPVHATRLYIGGDASQLHPLIGYIDEVRISGIARQAWEFNVNLARSYVFPTRIDFGKVLLGQNRVENFWISNTGLEVLHVQNLAILSETPTMFTLDRTAFDLNPGQEQKVSVAYIPTRIGAHLATVKLTTNNLFPDRSVTLQGVCIDTTETGPYVRDAQTLSLIHFEQSADTLISTGRVFWSDTSRFGSSSLRFKGGFVEFGMDTTLDLSISPLTIEMWISLASLPGTQSTLLMWGNASSSILLRVNRQNNSGLEALIQYGDGQTILLSGLPLSRLNLNQWYHLSLTWDGDTLKWYNNNQLFSKSAFSGNLTFLKNTPVRLGANYAGATTFAGWIDELRFSLTARKSWEYNVIPATIAPSASHLTFSSVPVNQTRVRELTLSNLGDQDLIISKIQSSDAVFTVPAFTGHDTIPRLDTRRMQVLFKPTTADRSYEGTLQISSNDTGAAISVITLAGLSMREKRNEPFAADDPNTRILYHFDSDPALPDTVLYDYSGGGKNGVIHGAAWVESGLYGESLFFDGDADWISIPSSSALVFDMLHQSFSIEFSFLTDTITTKQWLVAKGREDSLHYGIYLDQDGKLFVPGFGGGGPRLSDGRWHQVAFTYNPSGNSILYVDGVVILSKKWVNTTGQDIGHPLLIGASVNAFGQRVGYFQGLIDEFRLSDIARDEWEIKPGDYGIQTAISGSQTPMAGNSLILTVQVPTGLKADTVYVFYRRGGGMHNYSRLRAVITNNIWRVTIPSDSVTLNGLEYYIDVASTSKFHYTAPPFSPVQDPFSMSIHHARIADQVVFQKQRVDAGDGGVEREQLATLFSIPTQLNAQKVDSVFKDLLPYNPYEWRLFWWHSSISQDRLNRKQTPVYIEHPNSDPSYFNFGPGRAFWLVAKTEKEFQIPTGVSMPTDTIFEVQINPGWNMVGSPYVFPVAWDDCIIMGTDLIRTIYAWRGEDGFTTDVSVLNPWEGYFIHNPDSVVARLIIPPKESGAANSETAPLEKRHIAYDLSKNEWLIRFSVESKGLRDLSNYAGARAQAVPGLDRFDQIEPPPSLGKQMRLYFDNSRWGDYPGWYTADIRKNGEEGYLWELSVENPYSNEPFNLAWTFENVLPEGWKAYLFDLTEGNASDLLKTSSLTRKSPSDKERYSFRLLVGSPAFIEENREGFSLEPITFALRQNYPNPFNPETTIRYSLPKAGEIAFTIYNVMGQQIYSVKQQQTTAGHYEIVWRGVNDYGHQVASGVYFYKLKTPEHVATKKMVIIR